MTDLEKIEMAVRRTATKASQGPFWYWLHKLADEIAKVAKSPDGEGMEEK